MLLQMTSSFFFFLHSRIIYFHPRKGKIVNKEFRRTYDLQRQATSRRRRKMEIKVPFLRLG